MIGSATQRMPGTIRGSFLPPEVVSVLIAAICRLIVVESALGITTCHEKNVRLVPEYLQRFEAPHPRRKGCEPESA